MLTKITISLATVGIVLAMSGCGDSSSDSKTAQTGVGYYVDSAVSGVNYVCGDITGKTGEDGKFTFEKGQDCTFSIAGIPLKTVSATNLVNDTKILENNVTVAQLLQSIDSDGNLSNGIQITDAVVKAIEDALDGSTSATKENVLENNESMATVVSVVGQKVDGVSGEVKPIKEVEEHLQKTQTSVIKDLIIGKTYYLPINDVDYHHVEKLKFDTDGKTLIDTWTEEDGTENSRTFNYSINDDILNMNGTDGDGNEFNLSLTISGSQTANYILAGDDKFYKTNEAASAALKPNTSNQSNDSNVLENLKFTTSYLNGKTLYNISKDDDGKYSANTFKFTDTKYFYQDGIVDNPNKQTDSYSIDEHGYIIFTEDGKTSGVRALSQDDDKITICWSDRINELGDDTCYGGEEYFYFDKTKAENAIK